MTLGTSPVFVCSSMADNRSDGAAAGAARADGSTEAVQALKEERKALKLQLKRATASIKQQARAIVSSHHRQHPCPHIPDRNGGCELSVPRLAR